MPTIIGVGAGIGVGVATATGVGGGGGAAGFAPPRPKRSQPATARETTTPATTAGTGKPPSPDFFGTGVPPIVVVPGRGPAAERREPGRHAAARAACARSRASLSFLSSAAASGFGSIVSSCPISFRSFSIAFSKRWCMKKARLKVEGA